MKQLGGARLRTSSETLAGPGPAGSGRPSSHCGHQGGDEGRGGRCGRESVTHSPGVIGAEGAPRMAAEVAHRQGQGQLFGAAHGADEQGKGDARGRRRANEAGAERLPRSHRAQSNRPCQMGDFAAQERRDAHPGNRYGAPCVGHPEALHHGVEKLLDAHARGDQDRPREHGRQQQSVMDAVADGLRRIPTAVELGAPPEQAEEHPDQQDEEDLPRRRPNVALRDCSECEERDPRQRENGVSAGEQPGDEDEHHRRDDRDGVQPRAPPSGGFTGPGAFVPGRPCAGRGQCAIPPGG